MGINKIKLKQIDADFSGLVGQYGSGYFATTTSLNSLSGVSVQYPYVQTGGFLYNYGNQPVSGVKDFFFRPTLSGKGLAKLEETALTGGNNTFIGTNTFDGNSVNFKYGSVNFISESFSMDSYSASGLANSSLSSFFVNSNSCVVDPIISAILKTASSHSGCAISFACGCLILSFVIFSKLKIS